MESSFASHSESFLASRRALKSIYSLYSGNDEAISCSSQLNMFPRMGLTLTLSFFWRSATAIQ